jgi:hypothetical protein
MSIYDLPPETGFMRPHGGGCRHCGVRLDSYQTKAHYTDDGLACLRCAYDVDGKGAARETWRVWSDG